MPNWCSNRVTIFGPADRIAEMTVAMTITKNNSQSISIAQLVPMPECLNGTRSPSVSGEFDDDGQIAGFVADPENTYWDAEQYEAARVKHYEQVAAADNAESMTGFRDWYDWQQANWGIKWGDCETFIDGDPHTETVNGAEVTKVTLIYDTPWAPFSESFWEKITKAWGVSIVETYREEGMVFLGVRSFKNGMMTYESNSSHTDIMPDYFDVMNEWWDGPQDGDPPDEMIDDWISNEENTAQTLAS